MTEASSPESRSGEGASRDVQRGATERAAEGPHDGTVKGLPAPSRAASLADFEAPPGGCSVALGFFDGVHTGHRAVLARAAEEGERLGARPVAFTFRNHPSTVLAAEPVALLSTFSERCRWIAACGVQVVWVDFDEAFASTGPEEYVREVLARRLQARHACSGASHRFGHGAAGDGATLRRMGLELGFGVTLVEPVRVGDETVSSSRIRELVRSGDVGGARPLLGRPYSVTSAVQEGAARGRGMGARTANLLPPPGKLMPARGVYAVHARAEGLAERAGVANLGVRPTFGEEREVLEVHLFDFEGDLYGRELEVAFVERLREERRFPDPDSLREQIARDVARAREILGD